jgi:cell wall-associated NlpC family hydrolase
MALTGCSNTTHEDPVYSVETPPLSTSKVNNKPLPSNTDTLLFLLHNEYQKWENTPYRLGGNSKNGLDCSALVQNVYQNSFNIELPRTTSTQVLKGTQIHKNKLKIADLVFFKTSHSMQHVGIYIGDNQFLHVSTSSGVIISSLDNVYWRSKYWQSRRIIQN